MSRGEISGATSAGDEGDHLQYPEVNRATMPQTDVDSVQQIITEELDVLADDIHVHDDTTLTFYVPTEQLDRAQEVVPGDVEVLEDHEYEYLVKTSL